MTHAQSLIYAVRREYGESFREVVKGYARLGYSKLFTRQILGFHSQLFYSLLRHFDLMQYFDRKNYNEACTPKGRGWPKGRRRKP